MTIRRNVDISAINSDFMAFELAIENAPEGTFNVARNIKFEIGEACDDFLAAMKRVGAEVCNCDGIREIECMMFAMIRDKNPAVINTAIGFGRALENAEELSRNDRASIIRRVERDGTFYATRAEWQALGIIPADDVVLDLGVEEHAEQQANGTWAIFSGVSFVRGGYLSKVTADEAIAARANELREAMA